MLGFSTCLSLFLHVTSILNDVNNQPTLLPTGATVEMEHFNRGTGRQQCRCIVPKAVYIVKKCSWGWANFSSKTRRAELKRLINEKSCCILLAIYIVLLHVSSLLNVLQNSNFFTHLIPKCIFGRSFTCRVIWTVFENSSAIKFVRACVCVLYDGEWDSEVFCYGRAKCYSNFRNTSS